MNMNGVDLPGSVLQQERSTGQVQVQHPQCQAGRDQGHGEPTGLPLRAGQGLGLQEIYQVAVGGRDSVGSLSWLEALFWLAAVVWLEDTINP